MADACYQAWKHVEFDRFDLNHDGQLTLQEWNDEQARIKKRLEEARLQMQNEFFRYADSDGNGSLNEKEFEQFLKRTSLDRANASKYLESIGGTMDFNEFVMFESSVPSDTFPFKSEPFKPWAENLYVNSFVQTKPMATNNIEPAMLPNIDVAAVDFAPADAAAPRIGIVAPPKQ